MAFFGAEAGRQKWTKLILRVTVPNPLRAVSHRTEESIHRETVITTQGNTTLYRGPEAAFQTPPCWIFSMKVSDCSYHFLLTGEERDYICGYSKSGLWSQVCKSWLLPTFFSVLLLILLWFRFKFFFTSLEDELMLVSLSPDTLWVTCHSLLCASKMWPPRKAPGTVVSKYLEQLTLIVVDIHLLHPPWSLPRDVTASGSFSDSVQQRTTSRILKHSFLTFLVLSLHQHPSHQRMNKDHGPGIHFKNRGPWIHFVGSITIVCQ